ncbi:MAG: chromate transporter, partial [Acidisphaera sp.]|nr:chromate transporter [Acidisphaera sp.]
MSEAPGLPAIFACFLTIGMQGFGGGLSAWMRREVVLRRAWLEEPQFLSGLALSQITPGPNAVNLAVFIGTTLRGWRGALAAFAGIMGLPMLLVLGAGVLYFRSRALPGLESALAGMGAVAIGLNLATGWRMTRSGVADRPGAAIMVATAL